MEIAEMNATYRHGSFFYNARYQVVGGILVAVGVPFLLRIIYAWETLSSINYQVTIVAAAIAHIGGYLIYKRLESFPGTTGFSTILPAFAVSYAVVFVTIFFFRLDYSRLQAAGSFIISSSWYFLFYIFTYRTRKYHLGLVPGGEIERLDAIENVVWVPLALNEKLPKHITAVVADLTADYSSAWERFITDSVLIGTPVYNVKQVVESLTGRVAIEHLSENTLGSLTPSPLYLVVKKVLDRVVAFSVLILVSPILLLVALAIKLDSPGPALFRQLRMGYRGKPFSVYKFRTMRVESSSPSSTRSDAITQDNDSRITRLGRFLRKTRIDELPQAINILQGEMSWIGPRPEAVVLSKWYEDELPFYRYRHIVLPGITGWAQVRQGHVSSVEDVNEKLYYDFYYIKNFSLWLDVVIALRTIKIMLTGYGAK